MKDNLAMACSGLCLAHCVAGPLLLILGIGGALFPWLDGEWIHYLLLIPVVVLALMTMPDAYKIHSSYTPILLVTIGICAMLVSFALPEKFEIWLMAPSAFFIISAHFFNKRLLSAPFLVQSATSE